MHGAGVDRRTTVEHVAASSQIHSMERSSSKGLMNGLQYRSSLFFVFCPRWSNGPPLALCVRPVHHFLVHLGPEESWVRVFLHEAVDFGLDFVEGRRGRILQALLGLFPGAVVNVDLPGDGETITPAAHVINIMKRTR